MSYRPIAMLLLGALGMTPALAAGPADPQVLGRAPRGSRNQGEIAIERQTALDRDITGLEAQLTAVGPCEFGKLDQIFGDLDRRREEMLQMWSQWFEEFVAAARRRLESEEEVNSRLPQMTAKRRTQISQAKEELTQLNKRSQEMEGLSSATPTLQDAKGRLEQRKTAINEEIGVLEDLIKSLEDEGAIYRVRRDTVNDMIGAYQSMKRRVDALSDKYGLLLRSKRRHKEDGCQFDPIPKVVK